MGILTLTIISFLPVSALSGNNQLLLSEVVSSIADESFTGNTTWRGAYYFLASALLSGKRDTFLRHHDLQFDFEENLLVMLIYKFK